MKNRWLFRRSCGLLAEKHLNWMLENYFKKTWEDREKDLENWKIAMRYVSRKHMDSTKTPEEFTTKFRNFLTHHNLRGAILVGKKLSKGLPLN